MKKKLCVSITSILHIIEEMNSTKGKKEHDLVILKLNEEIYNKYIILQIKTPPSLSDQLEMLKV